MCPLYEVQRSLPLNVTGFGVAQRVLLYFLNLSRADFWLENTAAFFSLSFLSFSIFILSSIVFLITSWGGEQNRLAIADIAERSQSDCISFILDYLPSGPHEPLVSYAFQHCQQNYDPFSYISE